MIPWISDEQSSADCSMDEDELTSCVTDNSVSGNLVSSVVFLSSEFVV